MSIIHAAARTGCAEPDMREAEMPDVLRVVLQGVTYPLMAVLLSSNAIVDLAHDSFLSRECTTVDTHQRGLEQLKSEPLPEPGRALPVQGLTDAHPYLNMIHHGKYIHGMHSNRETDIGWYLISTE